MLVMIEPEASPDRVVELFSRHQGVHPYGLADLDEPNWSMSTWWRRGDAAVGLLELPSSTPIVYAVNAIAPDATLALLAELDEWLPDRYVVNGPTGLTDRLRPLRGAVWRTADVKMVLADLMALEPDDDGVVPLDADDLPELERLFATDSREGRFFVPDLLDAGHYRGVWLGRELVGAAGTHVVSPRFGVAAIGNVVTHPDHRRRGLARRTTSAVVRSLMREVDTIGLNVARAAAGTRRLYDDLGFVAVLDYEEAELVRHGSGASRE